MAGLLLLWYPGQEGGSALADVLLGQVSPSGRLPFAIPTHADHLPPFAPRAAQITYDLWHGYRRLQRHHHPAAYPFGFGLSYSALVLSEAALLHQGGQAVELGVQVQVQNCGPMAAAAVVQVYLEPPGLAVERPPRTLVAFQRVPLQAGESRRISLAVPLRRLAFFDEQRDGFVLEGGHHRLVLAQHSEDPGLACGLDLQETWLGP